MFYFFLLKFFAVYDFILVNKSFLDYICFIFDPQKVWRFPCYKFSNTSSLSASNSKKHNTLSRAVNFKFQKHNISALFHVLSKIHINQNRTLPFSPLQQIATIDLALLTQAFLFFKAQGLLRVQPATFSLL